MKNILRNSNFGFTKWCIVLIAAAWMGVGASQATVLLEENFTFTGALTANGWTATSGAGTSAITTQSVIGLTYTGHPGSGVGNAAGFVTTGEDDQRLFTAQNSGAVYASALINLSAAQSGGDYFFGINNSSTSFAARLYAKSSGSGYVLGIGKSSSAVVYETTVRDFNSTYLVVLKYSFLSTTADDTVALFVGPAIGGTEGAASLTTGSTIADVSSLGFVLVRQGSSTAAPTGRIDAIRVGTTWADVTPAGSSSSPSVTPSVSTLTGFTTTAGTASAAQTFTVTGANLSADVTVTAPTGFEVATNGTDFAASKTLTQTAGAVSGTISVRIAASTAQGTLASANVTLVSGATSGNVAVSGTVTAAGTPSVIVSPTSATGLTNYVGQVSASTNYTVTGTNLGGTNLVVTASTNAIEVSTNSSTGYTNSFSLAPSVDGTLTNTVYVRISALAPAGAVSATVGNVSGVASNNFTVSGTVTTPALTLVLNPTTVAEDAGASASTGTVGIPTVLSSNLVVSLVSSNTAAATVPSTVTITNGQTNATFAIAAVATTNSYAGATAVITASVTNYTSASATLTVSNVDVAPITTISLASLAADSYTQSFDALGTASIPGAISGTVGAPASLAAVIGSSPLNGWYATKIVGTAATPTAITADTGSGTSALVYSYGAASATDRALGVLASGTSTMAIGALIKNDTGATINSIKVSFTAEFWRSSTSVQNVLTCAIGKVDGSTITTANFLTDPSAIPFVRANITGPLPVSSNGLLDGNAVANQVAFTDVVIPLQLAAGETGFVRWSDFKDAGSNAGLAIDNLKMTASLDLPAADGDGAVSLANSTPSSPYLLSGIWAAGGSSQKVSVNVTPLLDSTTLTSASVLVPAEFGVPVVGNVTTSGGATSGTPTVVGQLITLSGVSITKTNPGVINIAGLSTPATGAIGAGNGVYPFTVSTAGDGGTLKAVFASPAANVLIPIGNIRDIDANGAPIDKNTIVAVEGICTASATSLNGTSFIQDANNGMAVYPATTTPAFTLGMVAGHKYAVVGTLVDYNGMAEIKPATASGVVDLGVATIPAPITITVAQAKAEQYESMLVRIADLTKDAAEADVWGSATTITVKDSGANTIDIRIQNGSTATSEPAYPVSVTGILAQFSSVTPRAATYQIMPRTAEDLSFAPGLKLAWSVSPVLINENGNGFDSSITFLTVSRVGSSAGTAVVDISISPTGRMLNNGSALPQTINFAAGETSKVLALTPVDDSVYTGDTVVTITATDKAGVLTLATATAQILEDETSAPADTTAPVITLRGSATITLDWAAAYIDAGATATDNVDGSVAVNSSGTVNTAKPGVYTISYTASDAAHNAAIPVVRTVTVSAPTSTPGADGVSGLLRYAFGANGPNDSVTKPTAVLSGGNLVLTAIVRVDDAKLAVVGEAVTDLGNYASGSAVTTVNGSSSGVDQTGVPTGCQRQAFTVPQGGDLKKFLRLKVNLAP
jgi:hypothetical protein